MRLMKRRARIYVILFVILLVTAVLVPIVIRAVSDYFHGGQHYYYPHDLQRGEYQEQRGEK